MSVNNIDAGEKVINELRAMQSPMKYEVEIIKGEPDHIGVPIREDLKARQLRNPTSLMMGYEVETEVDGDDAIIFLPLRAQSNEVNPDVWYPAVEWRLTRDTLDNADIWPEWKPFPFVVEGQIQRGAVGEELKIWRYVIITCQDMDEKDDGLFFDKPPFTNPDIKVATNGMSVIKGESILDRLAARKVLSGDPLVGATRRRG